MKRLVISGSVLALIVTTTFVGAVHGAEKSPWIELFDGTSLNGWHISQTNGHGNTTGWTVVDGSIDGTQDKKGNGGILLTDREFGDFVLELELNPDWGLDSGLFLRSTESGQCYQMMVDYYEGGNVGGIYGEGIGGFHFPASTYDKHYKKGEWNKVVIVCTGNPPAIDVWLNGEHITSYQGDSPDLLPAKGRIALQVHAGDGFFGKHTRFRNIRIRPLD
ncbi:MAG: DUF1080 domain-containing protein [Candidatus Hydrogenedentes bacterium]|nr:DUF1080 domain-containing protein [Candidatus Hydrogenedentota bacterium]